jgi:multiple sugar transport system substrate-binding protein
LRRRRGEMMRRYLIALVAALACLGLAACGGGDDDEGGGVDAETLEPDQAEGASGDVTWCIGADTTGAFQAGIDAFNDENPDMNAKLIELPEPADQQREQQVQRLEAESPECDVLGMDVIWTAEYAAQGWLYDLTPVVEAHEGEFIPSTVESTEYEDQFWALPFNTNAGFLYYRTDEVGEAPSSWEDVYASAGEENGLIYQGAEYEGLTVNFLELLYSAGGSVLSEDGETVEIDSDQTREVLDFMAQGVEDGTVPKANSTYEEEEARRAFENGQATFMRNWPYAYALATESDIADDFDIATFPSYGGAEGAGVLGGYNLGISAFSENPEAALALSEFLVTPEIQETMMIDASLPATVSEVYDDPQVQKATPFAEELRTAVEQAQPRPVSPVYPQISEAIYENVYATINGRMSSDEAVSSMNDQIQEAVETF